VSLPREETVRAVADVEALVFDVFGTVVDWRGRVAGESGAFLARHAPDVDPAAFADAWRRRYSPAMEEVRSGRRPFTRLDVLHLENLATILPEFGIDPVAIPPYELEALNLAWRRLDPWPDAVPGLTRLKRRFIIAPLSNGNIRLMLDLAKRAPACPGTPSLAQKSPRPTSRAQKRICATPKRSCSNPRGFVSSPHITETWRRRVVVGFAPHSSVGRWSMDRVRLPTLGPNRIGTQSQAISRI
jgi:hypothetical protein